MFDVEAFIAACEAAIGETQPMLAVKDILERAVADPDHVTTALNALAGVELLHRSDRLTIASVMIPPGLPQTLPHDHRMWALVGVYGGQEDNEFYRRADGGLDTSGGRTLHVGDTLLMGDDTIHAIRNPLGQSALAAIHVYGGDLVGTDRSMWTRPDFEEKPYDDKKVVGGGGFRTAE